MKQKTVYLKADKKIEVKKDKVYLGDVFQIVCNDTILHSKLNEVLIIDFGLRKYGSTNSVNRENRAVISVMKVIEQIQKVDENVRIVSLGESDVVIERRRKLPEKQIWTIIKVIFVSFISFFGTAYTIMAFHNDINVINLFEHVYTLFGLQYPGGIGPLELGYSIGLSVGILVFYNHIGKRRINKDPTPLEVEMRVYEENVNQTLIDTASREGIEIDAGKSLEER